jgi:predicted Zn finger-like uncharacterized protein
MKIVCDACSAKYSIADEKVRGKVFKIRCKKCSNIIVVRGSAGEGAADQPAPTFEKETKVFDYSGYDNAADAAAAAGVSEDQVWHLVIDQEQIGPMTVAEVKERFDRGEVDADSYVWREGFGDWERLADVDVFAGVVSGNGSPAGGLFGGGGDDGRTVQSDPADLFAARGGDEDDGGAASNDLFSGGGGLAASAALAASSASSDDEEEGGLFGSAGVGMAAAPAASKASVGAGPGVSAQSNLTGQRNENSVLFSLNNLAALASDSSPRHPVVSTSSSASAPLAAGSSSGMAQGEGSGLIDIRSMAQVYLGDSPQKPMQHKSAGSGSVDDLPVFSQTSFESASPVLLPTAQPSVNNRLLFALVGLIGVLVIAAVVLVIVVLKGGDDDKGTKVAAVAADDADKDKDGDKDKTDPTAPAGAETPTAPTNIGATPEPAVPTPVADKGAAVGKPSSRDEKKDRRSSSSSSSSKPAEKPPEKKPPEKKAADPLASSGCDEVTCLVEPDKACCRKGGSSKRSSSSSSSSSPDPNLPERPSRSDVSGGMSKVKGRVSSCGDKHGGKGTVMVKIKISPSGSVASASASGGSSGLTSCVQSAVRGARFSKSQLGITVNYPFVF